MGDKPLRSEGEVKMELHKYNSNFGKALFLSWWRSILYVFIAFVVLLIYAIIEGAWGNALKIFLIVMVVTWPLDLLWRWKSIVLMGDELIVKRILRPRKSFSISENLISYSMTGHGLYGATFFVKPVVRVIDPEGSITDIRCTFLTKKNIEKLMSDINSNKRVYMEGEVL